MHELQIAQKSVYGNVLLYPHNETAKLFAQLLNVKTFNDHHLSIIKQLGYTVTSVNQAVIS